MAVAAVACPLQTESQGGETTFGGLTQPGELRAYKLGRRRWSYNQVELVLTEAGSGSASGRCVAVERAVHLPDTPDVPEAHKESTACFDIHLESGAKLRAVIYLCHSRHELVTTRQPSHLKQHLGPNPGTAPHEGTAVQQPWGAAPSCAWKLVTRDQCCKGCQGPLLRSIQRFGKLGRARQRSSGRGASESPEARGLQGEDCASTLPSQRTQVKDPRFLYLSLDEACTHVGATAFRLVAGLYDKRHGSAVCLLATAVSLPIRVLANNDVPTGAANIRLEAELPAGWEGWGSGLASPRMRGRPRGEHSGSVAKRRRQLQFGSAVADLLEPPLPPPLAGHSLSSLLAGSSGRHQIAVSAASLDDGIAAAAASPVSAPEAEPEAEPGSDTTEREPCTDDWLWQEMCSMADINDVLPQEHLQPPQQHTASEGSAACHPASSSGPALAGTSLHCPSAPAYPCMPGSCPVPIPPTRAMTAAAGAVLLDSSHGWNVGSGSSDVSTGMQVQKADMEAERQLQLLHDLKVRVARVVAAAGDHALQGLGHHGCTTAVGQRHGVPTPTPMVRMHAAHLSLLDLSSAGCFQEPFPLIPV